MQPSCNTRLSAGTGRCRSGWRRAQSRRRGSSHAGRCAHARRRGSSHAGRRAHARRAHHTGRRGPHPHHRHSRHPHPWGGPHHGRHPHPWGHAREARSHARWLLARRRQPVSSGGSALGEAGEATPAAAAWTRRRGEMRGGGAGGTPGAALCDAPFQASRASCRAPGSCPTCASPRSF